MSGQSSQEDWETWRTNYEACAKKHKTNIFNSHVATISLRPPASSYSAPILFQNTNTLCLSQVKEDVTCGHELYVDCLSISCHIKYVTYDVAGH